MHAGLLTSSSSSVVVIVVSSDDLCYSVWGTFTFYIPLHSAGVPRSKCQTAGSNASKLQSRVQMHFLNL